MSLFVKPDRSEPQGEQSGKPERPGKPDQSGKPEEPAERAEEAQDRPGTAEEEPAGRSRLRAVLSRTLTVLAFLLVLFGMLLPNQLERITPQAFARIPLEAVLGVLLIVFIQPRARRAVVVSGGVLLGLVTVVKIVDIGFNTVLARTWDPVLDWTFVTNGVEFVDETAGKAGAVGAAVGVVLLIVGVLVLTTLAVLRLSRVAVRHETWAVRAAAALGVAWLACAVIGVQVKDGGTVASYGASSLVYKRVMKIRSGLNDKEKFAREARVDVYAKTPAARMLTGLRGKDVLLVFVESYGRDAVEEDTFAPQVDAVLDGGTARLGAAGFTARSGWLKSPTAGGGSWLAHSTMLSGLWIDNQQRYNNLTNSDRFTLNQAFQRADWRTVAMVAGVRRAWPEGDFFGYDKIYTSTDMGYRGPRFSWATMPDQYVLSAFERLERSRAGREPIMAEMPLVSSHLPWVPVPRLIGWDQVGDGSVFAPMAKVHVSSKDYWRDPGRVRTQYRLSIEYTLSTLIGYLEKYGDDDLVTVFLGDHQPAPIVVGSDAPREVPITIVAKDRKVIDQVAGWRWTDGLKPGPQAPVWPMNEFRDRFLNAFGSTPTSG